MRGTSPPTMENTQFGRDLTEGSIPRHLVMFSLPMLAGNLIQTAYSIVNAIWVGKGLGKTDLAAVTVSFPVIFVLVAVASGLTMATGILIAQYAGARDWPQLRRVVQTSTLLSIVVSVVITPVGQAITPWILQQLRTPPDVLPPAISYMRIFLFTIPFNFGIFLVVSMLRGVGDSKTPLYFQGGALLASVVADPIFMFGWLGFPRMGLNGTALVSVLMQAIALAGMFYYLGRQDHIVMPDWRHLRAERNIACLLVKIGFPSMVQQSLVSVGMLFVTGFVNAFGENATAAFGAAMRIDQIAFMPAMTIGMAVSTLVGQNIGANRMHRAVEVFWWGSALSGGITILCTLVAFFLPQALLRMFVSDPAVMAMGVSYLHIVGASYICFALMFVGNGVINGAGYTFVTTVISLVSLWIVRVPLAAYLSHAMHSVDGVWYAMALSSLASMVISLGYYFSGLWKRPIIHPHLAVPAPTKEA